jgi:hypothetical protein
MTLNDWEREVNSVGNVMPQCVCGSIKNTVMGCPVCDPIEPPPKWEQDDDYSGDELVYPEDR